MIHQFPQHYSSKRGQIGQKNRFSFTEKMQFRATLLLLVEFQDLINFQKLAPLQNVMNFLCMLITSFCIEINGF